MSLSRGHSILAIPGPSVIPDRVLRAMHTPAPNIYEGDLIDTTDMVIARLKVVAGTQHYAAMYIANGHGAWEAALANCFSRGDKALFLTTGRFAKVWSEVATKMGIDCEILDFGNDSDVAPDLLEKRLKADKNHEIKAILTVQTDTATSVNNDIPAIRKVMNQCGHPALLMVDCIASFGIEEFHMDTWGVDVMVTGSQKGLMCPPGMSFVFFNPKADAAREKANCNTAYWDWHPRTRGEVFYQKFYGTAATHHILALDEALKMIVVEEGLPNVWRRHRVLASAVWTAVDTWSGHGGVSCNIQDRSKRSVAVTTVLCGQTDGDRLRRWVTEHTGVTLGIGLPLDGGPRQAGKGMFRIGHMGYLNPHMILGTLGSVQAGLNALGIPHDPAGIIAATNIIAQER